MWWVGICEAVSNAVKSVADFATTAKENQSETEIIKEKRVYKEGLDIAEKIIALLAKYIDGFTEKDKKKFIKLYDDFMEKN